MKTKNCSCLAVAVLVAIAVSAFAGDDDAVEVRVKPTPGGPMLHLNGKPVPPRFFFGSIERPKPGKPAEDVPFYRTLPMVRDAGVRFISFGAPLCWNEPGKESWTAIDALFRRILAIYPEALLLPRFGVDAPAWLKKMHHEWYMKFEEGTID